MTLDTLNRLPAAEAEAELLRCCGSRRWAQAMAARRPFASVEHAHEAALEIWQGLGREDWLEAFSHHPRIGENALRARFAATRQWSEQEQSGVAGASEETLHRLLAGNDAYDRRFGHVFLICATGKSAEEMLAALEARIRNTPETELRIAAGEQAKITRIRMEKLFETA